MAQFKDLGSLLSHVKGQINETLVDDVKRVVAETEAEQIELVVYGSYSPVMYERRGEGGGLGDISNINGELVEDGVLSVKNRTPSSPSVYGYGVSENLAEWVNEGRVPDVFHGADTRGYPWTGARDFKTPTVEQLQDGKAKEALRQGLEKRGIITKK